jgi:single-strand DNA-binding protein
MPATAVTVTGNLTDTPKITFTPAGVPVASFTVASNERYRDQSGTWQDGPSSFFRVNAWRDLGEHVAESLDKGDRVTVDGTIRQRTYEVEPKHPGDSGKRTVWEIHAREVGAALSYATVKVSRIRRDTVPVPEEPWAREAPPASADNFSDEPPF